MCYWCDDVSCVCRGGFWRGFAALDPGGDDQGLPGSARDGIGYIYGGIAANATHVRCDPDGLNAAIDRISEVVYTPEPGTLLVLSTGMLLGLRCRG